MNGQKLQVVYIIRVHVNSPTWEALSPEQSTLMRIAKASVVFERLRANVLERNGIKLDTKLKGTANTLVCM